MMLLLRFPLLLFFIFSFKELVAAEIIQRHPFPCYQEGHISPPFMEWIDTAQQILEEDSPKKVVSLRDHIWLFTSENHPHAIFKPFAHPLRKNVSGNNTWRLQRNLNHENASISLAHALGFGDYVSKSIPTHLIPRKFIYRRQELNGLLEQPVFLLPSHGLKDHKQLTEFGSFLLHQSQKMGANASKCLSLQEFNNLIDGKTNTFRHKRMSKNQKKLSILGSPEFQRDHLQYFLKNINMDSLIMIGLMDMLFYHRDMKSDNVMLQITDKGIGFVVIDLEYAMLPLTLLDPTNEEEKGYMKNAVDIHFRPFYLDFPQAESLIPMGYFNFLAFLSNISGSDLKTKGSYNLFTKEGFDDFEKRFIWLTQMARDVVQDKIKPMSLKELHKSFCQRFDLKKKIWKHPKYYNKARYRYTSDEFILLNPFRSGYETLDLSNPDLIGFEASLVYDDAQDQNSSRPESERVNPLDGYEFSM